MVRNVDIGFDGSWRVGDRGERGELISGMATALGIGSGGDEK
jgi:hypothetical protein